MATSPSTANYFQGTGVVSFTQALPTVEAKRDLGNCPSFNLQPDFETREHKSFRGGSVTVDDDSIISKKAIVTVQLDEITPENLAMLLFGTISTNSGGNKVIAGLLANKVTGALELVGANDRGSKYTVIVPDVSFNPTGSIDLIGESDGLIELSGVCRISAGSYFSIEETAAAA